jgi:hypothetical protein
MEDKIWLLDFDYIPTNSNWYPDIEEFLYKSQPINTDKLISFIPSNNGIHVITKGFDTREFVKKFPDVEIHKNNPTNLYIP